MEAVAEPGRRRRRRGRSPTATVRRSATSWSRTSWPPPSCRRCRWTGAARRPRPRGLRPDERARRRWRRRGVERRWRAVVTRTLVDAGRPGLRQPDQADRALPARPTRRTVLVEHGQTWEDRGERGLAARRRVAGAARDPRRRPRCGAGRRRVRRRGQRRWRHPGRARVRRQPARRRGRHRQGPRRRAARPDRRRRRPRDRDRRRARRAAASAPPTREPLGRVDVRRMRALRRRRASSPAARWGPKVEAVCRFVEQGGCRAVITGLANILDAVGRRDRHRRRTRLTSARQQGEQPCPSRSRSARSRCTTCPTPAGSPS